MRPPVAAAAAALAFAAIAAPFPGAAAAETAASPADPAKDRMDFADGLYSRDMYDMALAEYDAVLADFPSYTGAATAHFRAAESLFSLKRYDEAITRYRDYMARYPDKKEAALADARIGESMYLLKKPEEALAHFSLLFASPSPAAKHLARYYTGKILYEKGSAEQAEGHFRAVSEADEAENEFRPFADFYLGEILLGKKRPEEAEALYRRAAAAKPDLKDAANFGLGKSLFMQNRFADADKAFSEVGRASAFGEDAFLNGLNALFNSENYAALIARARDGAGTIASPEKKKEVRLLQADAHVRAKQYEEAFRIYDDIGATGDAGDRAVTELKKIEALLDKGDLAAALDRLASLKEFDPAKKDELYFLAAKVYTQLKKPADAIAELEHLVADMPNSPRAPEALLNQGYLYLEMNQPRKARQAMQEFLRRFPSHPSAEKTLYDVILIDLKLGTKYGVASDAKMFLDTYPESDKTSKVLLRLGSVYTDLKDYESADKTYQKYFEKFSTSADAAEAYFAAGYNQQLAGQYDKAVEYYDKVSKAGSEPPLIYSTLKNRAYCFVSLQKFDDAARDYDQMISSYPDNDLGPEGYFWLADHYAEGGDSAKLDRVLEKFRIRPDAAKHAADIEFYEGESLRLRGLHADAVVKYDAAVSKNGALKADAHFGKGMSHVALGEVDAARSQFEEVLKLAPDDQELAIKSRLELANILFSQAKYEEAAKANMAIGILYDDPQLIPQALMRAGESFEKAGKTDHARQVYKELTERFANHPLAAKAADRLKAGAS